MKATPKTVILAIVIALIAIVWISSLISAIAQKSHTRDSANTDAVVGLTIDRDTYVASCKHGYNQTGVPPIGDSEIANYCGCTYDTGISRFGETLFLQKLGSTPLPSDISKIVNACLQEALS